MRARNISAAVTATVAALLTIAACSSGPDNCEDLATSFQSAIQSICDSDAGVGKSSYCSVCVSAGLYSYLPNSSGTSGTCTCWPLILTATTCSSTLDHEAILGAVAAAGRECVDFQLPDGGGPPFPDAASPSEAAADNVLAPMPEASPESQPPDGPGAMDVLTEEPSDTGSTEAPAD